MQKTCEIVKLLHSVFKVCWWLEFNEGLVHNNNNNNNNNNNSNNNNNNSHNNHNHHNNNNNNKSNREQLRSKMLN